MKTSNVLLWGLLGGVGIYLWTTMNKKNKPCGCKDKVTETQGEAPNYQSPPIIAPQTQTIAKGVQERLVQGTEIALLDVQNAVSR